MKHINRALLEIEQARVGLEPYADPDGAILKSLRDAAMALTIARTIQAKKQDHFHWPAKKPVTPVTST
jgi:hypothetical protein